MASVEVVKAEKRVNNEVEITLDARTSVGRIDIPLRFEDQGSEQRNETRAFEQALVLVEQIASALRLRLGSCIQVPPVSLGEK